MQISTKNVHHKKKGEENSDNHGKTYSRHYIRSEKRNPCVQDLQYSDSGKSDICYQTYIGSPKIRTLKQISKVKNFILFNFLKK